ncbi:10825_t:CDS:2 [Scutellospora calospora]|uniref:10825_t:CDS:1 n=1 Tax=Scutellospora calospora TaxID=85575 RepID=A0ACA9JWA7_9GLOM|nr:10825_t:CDS:2 [Scutellospora calospora]
MINYRESNSWLFWVIKLTNKPGYGWPDIFHWRNAVFVTIFPVVASSTIFTSIICILYIVYDIDLTLPEIISKYKLVD